MKNITMVNHEKSLFASFGLFTFTHFLIMLLYCLLIKKKKERERELLCIQLLGVSNLKKKNDLANKSIAKFLDTKILLPDISGVNILLQG